MQEKKKESFLVCMKVEVLLHRRGQRENLHNTAKIHKFNKYDIKRKNKIKQYLRTNVLKMMCVKNQILRIK